MTTLSIILPDMLAQASQEAAKRLGLSRTEFIRRAIAHELANVAAKQEEQAMVKSMLAMKKDKDYLMVAEEISSYLNSELPPEAEEWWKNA